MRLDEPGPLVHEPVEQGAGDAERRVGHDVERAARQPQVACVGRDDDELAPEAGAQVRGPAGVRFDGDDPRPDLEERRREGPEPGTDVEDEVAGADPGVSDEPLGPPWIELVPSPRPP